MVTAKWLGPCIVVVRRSQSNRSQYLLKTSIRPVSAQYGACESQDSSLEYVDRGNMAMEYNSKVCGTQLAARCFR